MYPIIFQLGPIKIYSYGFFLALAYLVATFIFWREGKRQGYQEEKLLDLSVASLIAAIIGGRLFYALINFSSFKDNPARIFSFWEGGFAYFGSFIFVFLTAAYLIRKWKWSFFQVADFGSLSVASAMVLSDIGSFLSGNDYGRATHLPWGVVFPSLVGPRHPTQIYAAVLNFILLVLLYRFYKTNISKAETLKSGATFFYFLFSSSLIRIFVEFLRGDSTYLFNLPLATVFSLIIAFFSLLGLYYYQFRSFSADTKKVSRYLLGINLKFRKPVDKD